MIIRGGGATGAAGRATGALICATLLGTAADGETLGAAGGAGAVVTPPACAAAGAVRGGTAMAGGATLAAGVVAAGCVTGALGGITTTEGGRYVAATEAGVTILGA